MDRAEKIRKYETIAAALKAFTKVKGTIQEIAAAFYQADIMRQERQEREMSRNMRMSRMPKTVGDPQRILDIGK